MPKSTLSKRLIALSLGIFSFLSMVRGASLSGVLEFDILRETALTRFGSEAVKSVSDWEQLVATSLSARLPAQLSATNDFFNERLRWMSDESIYGVEDYWATPLESLAAGEADCEDFSIAKYVTLLALGVDPKSLRLIYVKAERPGGVIQAHMVLAWYAHPAAAPLILDNINAAVLPAANRQDLTPIFSFNADDLWIGGATGPSSAKPQMRLSRWRQVLDRIVDEGFKAHW